MSLIWTNLNSILLALSLSLLCKCVSNVSLCFLFTFHSRGRTICPPTQVEVPLPTLRIKYPPILLIIISNSSWFWRNFFQEFLFFFFSRNFSFWHFYMHKLDYHNYKQNKSSKIQYYLTVLCMYTVLMGNTHTHTHSVKTIRRPHQKKKKRPH